MIPVLAPVVQVSLPYLYSVSRGPTVSMFMAAMQFIVKFFPEITIKSKPVRRQFAGRLARNLRRVFKAIDADVEVRRDWDKLVVTASDDDPALKREVVDALGRLPGIAWYLDVLEYPLGDFDDVAGRTEAVYGARLAGRRFAVRCKRQAGTISGQWTSSATSGQC